MHTIVGSLWVIVFPIRNIHGYPVRVVLRGTDLPTGLSTDPFQMSVDIFSDGVHPQGDILSSVSLLEQARILPAPRDGTAVRVRMLAVVDRALRFVHKVCTEYMMDLMRHRFVPDVQYMRNRASRFTRAFGTKALGNHLGKCRRCNEICRTRCSPIHFEGRKHFMCIKCYGGQGNMSCCVCHATELELLPCNRNNRRL